MSNEHSSDNVGNFGNFVNSIAVLLTVTLIGAEYFQRLSAFSGVA